MKIALLFALVSVAFPRPAQPQSAAQPSRSSQADVAEAYDQFLLGRHLDSQDDTDGAIAAYTRAIALDPTAADIAADLSAVYMRSNRLQDAVRTAEQALKISPTNREGNRVLGLIYAALSAGRSNAPRAQPGQPGERDENVAKAIQHLELALDKSAGDNDPNARAMLGRLYVQSGAYGKAIPLLSALITDEPGWQEGPALLVEAYVGAGRTEEAVTWMEQAAPQNPQLYPTLGEFYERQRRWKDAAQAYATALDQAPNNVELRTRYASTLLNVGDRASLGKARDTLHDVLSKRPNEPRVLYLMSQAQRRLGDLAAAEAAARSLISQNAGSPWGYYALAEALEQRRQYQDVVDTLAPVVEDFRAHVTNAESFELGLLLPHLGFAYQELGDQDKALAAFSEAHRLAPDDSAITGYLIQANLVTKKYAVAIDLAKQALSEQPDDLRITELEAQALRQSGRTDEGIALLETTIKTHGDDPTVYVALAQIYSDAARGAQAVKLLKDAEGKFPTETSIPFELGAVLDKQKRFADAEAAFKQVLQKEPENAQALNYLGYMLADRGSRLDESVALLKKAVSIDPDNGSYLDSLGWAYYKADRLDLAEGQLKRAANQLKSNSVVQQHYGELLFKLGRYDEAIAAWTRALNGDGEEIKRPEVEKRIRTARQRLEKK